jgi:hypothetical protein
MPQTGYQDWQRVAFQSGQSILNLKQAFTVGFTSASFPVSAWQYVQAFMQCPAGSDYYQVIFGWYADPQSTNLLASNSLVVGPGNILQLPVAVQGPYLVIFVTPHTGANAQVITMSFYGASARNSQFDMASYSGPLMFDQSAYAINQQKIFVLSNLYYGRGSLEVAVNAANPAKAALQYLFFSGAFYTGLETWGDLAVNLIIHQEVFLPAAPAQIVITNGGVAQTITTTLHPMPE